MTGLASLDHGFELTAETYPLVRIRLAEEIHRRAYHDVGIEVSPDGPGPELERTYLLATPYCLQGHRVVGQLSWETDRARLTGPDGGFRSWEQFCAHAFEALGASGWRTRRHLGCFHRRGKARYDLAFSVAARLVTGGPAPGAATTWPLEGDRAQDEPFVRMITRSGAEILLDRPSRHLLVMCCGEPLAALRSDGRATTAHGVLALNELWWRGVDVERQAYEVCEMAQHTHGRRGAEP